MRTIVQKYGPIYGEPVNGTVLGRPNGSVYVPAANTATIVNPTVKIRNQIAGANYRVRFCNDSGTVQYYAMSAQSQDVSSNLRPVIATDATLETIVGYTDYPAGQFNWSDLTNFIDNYQLDSETTYYLAVLLMNNGVPVATSTILECTVWSL